MWTQRLLEEIESKKDVGSILKSLNLSRSELRAAIKTLKQLGVPVVRKSRGYELGVAEVPPIRVRNVGDVLTVAKEVTKVLRFIYGENVKYLWPNKVVRGSETLLKISEGGLEHKLPPYAYVAVVTRASQALKRRRMPEVVSSLNALLYKSPVEIRLKSGKVLRGRISNVDIYGKAYVNEAVLEAESVEDVFPL